jgi:2-oxoglutarate dehydrogenase complex dehydrogenase (E1) component-like enzyme
MRDKRFRDKLPLDLDDEIQKYLNNPGCQCNTPLYIKVLRECKKQIEEYYPGKEISLSEDEIEKSGYWSVINCNINELEKKLKDLNPLHKQIAIARWQDQATVIIHED